MSETPFMRRRSGDNVRFTGRSKRVERIQGLHPNNGVPMLTSGHFGSSTVG